MSPQRTPNSARGRQWASCFRARQKACWRTPGCGPNLLLGLFRRAKDTMREATRSGGGGGGGGGDAPNFRKKKRYFWKTFLFFLIFVCFGPNLTQELLSWPRRAEASPVFSSTANSEVLTRGNKGMGSCPSLGVGPAKASYCSPPRCGVTTLIRNRKKIRYSKY